jgi:fluoride exporter
MSWILIAVGSALGGMSRHACGLWFARLGAPFPWGTFVVNVLGSLGIGLVAAALVNASVRTESAWLRDFAMIGFLGGFTTFSAFSWQTLQLLRDGKLLIAGANVIASVMICLIACWIGFSAGARLAPR